MYDTTVAPIEQSTISRNPYENVNFPCSEIRTSLVELPTPANGNIAVATSSIDTAKCSFTDFGMASPQSTGSDNPKVLCDTARFEAQNRVVTLARQAMSMLPPPGRPTIDVTPQATTALDGGSQRPPTTKQSHGGGSKPASDKQMACIEAMCAQQGQNLSQVAQQICGVRPDELRGMDASKIIQFMKTQQRRVF